MESNKTENNNKLYPIFLKLEELELLLVGAGNVGLEKLQSLLSNSPAAKITIVAPVIKEEVRELLQNHPSCILVQRSFEESDLKNKDLIVLATDNKELHKKIKALAKEKRILVNVADTPELCDFYLGSIVQKGNLKIAISTNGKSPTIAKRVKEVLNETIPGEIDDLLSNMQSIRNKMSGDFAEKVKQLNELTKQLCQNQ
jgi:siroheme synthase-like protein